MKPRVLAVIPGSPEGSSMIFAKRQAAALERSGCSLTIFHLASRTHPVRVWTEYVRLRATIRSVKPDMVHAMFGTMTAFVCALATTRPLAVTYYGGDLNPGATSPWIRSFLGRLLSQLAALRAKVIICVSPELKGRLWWRRSIARVIPTGVDTTRFFPMNRDVARSRVGWNDAPVILFNAGFDPRRKRLDLAEAAFELARRELPELRLVVSRGDVPPHEMPTWMNAADVLLITSDSEGSPTVVHEAMACALPIVSVDVGDVRQRLAGSSPSAIVDRDPAALARALLDVVREPTRSNGPEIVRPRSQDVLANEIMQLYEGVRSRG